MEDFDVFDYQPEDGKYVFVGTSAHQESITIVANAEPDKRHFEEESITVIANVDLNEGYLEKPTSGIKQATSISDEASVRDNI